MTPPEDTTPKPPDGSNGDSKGLWGALKNLIDKIQTLPTAQRLVAYALGIVAIIAIVAIPVAGAQYAFAILLLVIGVIVTLVLLGMRNPKAAYATLIGFVVLSFGAAVVLAGPKLVTAQPRDPTPQAVRTVTLHGTVLDEHARTLANASVGAVGDGVWNKTSPHGDFELAVAQFIASGDSIVFLVQTPNSDSVIPLSDPSRKQQHILRLPPGSIAPAQPAGGTSAATRPIRWAVPSESGSGHQSAMVRVIVDSIRALRRVGGEWEFVLRVNGRSSLQVARSDYTTNPRGLKLVGSEVRVRAPIAQALGLQVTATRAGALFGAGTVTGEVTQTVAALPGGVPRPLPIAVGGRGPTEAAFVVYCTLIRLPSARSQTTAPRTRFAAR